MNYYIRFLFAIFVCLSFLNISRADTLDSRLLSYVNGMTNSISQNIKSILSENDTVKYLDLSIGVQENLKPTISVTNVNKIAQTGYGILFNQNSLSVHNQDQTINLGIGHRTLLNEDKIILGINAFLDYSFDDSHQRNGAGVEVISSLFDLRSNIYDATSGIENVNSSKTEEAMDGWDIRLDYHLPAEINTRIFASKFDFENGKGDFELEGERYGLNLKQSNYDFELGYIDDNKTGDGVFANISYVVPLGPNFNRGADTEIFEYEEVSDRLYEPVKRENKIRVLTTVLNIKASGF